MEYPLLALLGLGVTSEPSPLSTRKRTSGWWRISIYEYTTWFETVCGSPEEIPCRSFKLIVSPVSAQHC
jgi:hypothetical protein